MPVETIKPEFHDPSMYADLNLISDALKDSFPAYMELCKHLEVHGYEHEWKYYNDGKTWLCKISKKKHTVVWLSAWKGYFKTTVYLQSKYLEEFGSVAIDKEKRESIILGINDRKNIPCTFDIRNIEDLHDLFTVMQFKSAHT
ncbi:MAG: DUF3788 family protein [bacterium]